MLGRSGRSEDLRYGVRGALDAREVLLAQRQHGRREASGWGRSSFG